VVCERVPQQALNKKVLEKHFARFGRVTKILVNLKKFSATVHFEDHKSAKKAKEKGLMISAKIPPIGAIFYTRTRKSSEMIASSSGRISVEPEVEDELSSMASSVSSNPFGGSTSRSVSSIFSKVSFFTFWTKMFFLIFRKEISQKIQAVSKIQFQIWSQKMSE
jgi:hypothetical protein